MIEMTVVLAKREFVSFRVSKEKEREGQSKEERRSLWRHTFVCNKTERTRNKIETAKKRSEIKIKIETRSSAESRVHP